VIGYSTQSVAQLTVAMVLSLLHHLPIYNEYVADGSYTQSGIANRLVPTYHETQGMTWGIVGYGNIGKRVAQVAQALGCHVVAFSRSAKEDVENVTLEELCRRSDIITIHTPLTDKTKNLIDNKMLALMKQTAIVVNAARGGVWDETAVADALISGKIGGIASDVYSAEPFPSNHPFSALRENPHACLTPHMAWGAYEARVRLIEEVAENICCFYDGMFRNRIV